MKYVIVCNTDYSPVALFNATGHIQTGLALMVPCELVQPRRFVDAERNEVAFMTDRPLIIMTARREEHIREAFLTASASKIPCNVFFDCMRTGEPQEQESYIRGRGLAELSIVAAGFFGSVEELKPITRRFSLYRDRGPAEITSLADYAKQSRSESPAPAALETFQKTT